MAQFLIIIKKTDNLNNKETFQVTDESSQIVIWLYREFWIQP